MDAFDDKNGKIIGYGIVVTTDRSLELKQENTWKKAQDDNLATWLVSTLV